MFEYNATVTRVVDGDTIDAIVDLGFSTFKTFALYSNILYKFFYFF